MRPRDKNAKLISNYAKEEGEAPESSCKVQSNWNSYLYHKFLLELFHSKRRRKQKQVYATYKLLVSLYVSELKVTVICNNGLRHNRTHAHTHKEQQKTNLKKNLIAVAPVPLHGRTKNHGGIVEHGVWTNEGQRNRRERWVKTRKPKRKHKQLREFFNFSHNSVTMWLLSSLCCYCFC